MRDSLTARYLNPVHWLAASGSISNKRVEDQSANVHDFCKKAKQQPNVIETLELAIHNNLNGLKEAWRALETRSNISIYQRYDWIKCCLDTIEKDHEFQPVIVTGRKHGKLVFAMPMRVQNGWIRQLSWIGGSHSNFNLALIDNEFGRGLTDKDITSIYRQITSMLPGIGCVTLCCQPEQWRGQPNPLMALPHQRSINNAFAMDLAGGFDKLLSAGNSKRKRKKFRYQTRIANQYGGAELVVANSPNEVKALLTEFYQQKSSRLRKLGLHNVFSAENARVFLEQLAMQSLDKREPILRLYGLKIDGKYRAICGGGVLAKHFSAYFTSFSDDELSHISPGEMLLYLLVKKLAGDEIKSMDLGGGEERYKRSWCPQTIELFDIVLPLSILSYPHIWAYRVSLSLKRQVRKNPYLWATLKRTRASFRAFTGSSSSVEK